MKFTWRGKLEDSLFGWKPVPKKINKEVQYIHIVT
jgi:hypothetical protein